ncbi:hypothetical protein C0J52_01878 [Blattella germanica]|nr:hypothetical protein C0J52_01878 [Blattella germanica]
MLNKGKSYPCRSAKFVLGIIIMPIKIFKIFFLKGFLFSLLGKSLLFVNVFA